MPYPGINAIYLSKLYSQKDCGGTPPTVKFSTFNLKNFRSGNLTLAFVKLSSQTENGGSPSILIRITLHDSDNILLHNRCVGYGNA